MSGETLRAAAALMRKRAEAAYRSPWRAEDSTIYDGEHDDDEPMAFVEGGVYRNQRNTTEHIASWHPAVALAVADALDASAAVIEEAADGPLALLAQDLAAPCLAVATAYLGTDQ